MRIRMTAAWLLALLLPAGSLIGCGASRGEPAQEGTEIHLSDQAITVNGENISTEESSAVYAARDIVFYLEGQGFTYGAGSEADEHSQAEADAHTVVHITQPGTYLLDGTLSAGQIAVDLGEDAEDDPEAVVTLVLNGVDLTCTVAPAVIFYHVYECGSADEETASAVVDTSAAGANVIIADGTENIINGSYVARIYRPDSVELSEDGTEVVEEKKLHKYDGAFYSCMSMNVDGGPEGTGVLKITAENEGLDAELHLTINGGNIYITSGNDGINTNEDLVSVTTVNGGTLEIQVTGETGEGDGIDSNGYLVINGGTVVAAACAFSADAGLDASAGITINGGTVMASGNMYDQIDGGDQAYVVFSFASRQSGGETYTLRSAGGEAVGTWTPVNDFQYLVISSPDLAAGDYTLWQGDAQLAGSASGGVMGGPGGDRVPPEDGRIPEERAPESGEPPADGRGPEDGPPADPPEHPAGEEPPESAEPPAAGWGPGQGGQSAEGRSETFPITDGGNFFTGISPLETAEESGISEG